MCMCLCVSGFVGWVWGQQQQQCECESSSSAGLSEPNNTLCSPFTLFRAKRSLSFLYRVLSETLRIGRPRNTSRYATLSAPFPFTDSSLSFLSWVGETPRLEIPSDTLSATFSALKRQFGPRNAPIFLGRSDIQLESYISLRNGSCDGLPSVSRRISAARTPESARWRFRRLESRRIPATVRRQRRSLVLVVVYLFFWRMRCGHVSCAGERKSSINPELWHACAGPLVTLPPVGSYVVYFPQGHSEQVSAIVRRCGESC